ncbi:alpha/beta fold hydrolase [Croceicoccus marinus]|jgi:pimeloyl-ACP methyl ester carboxylesterase|uniref:Alpha/beta fold hydrolase n=1 Tax=Croceicoccus marinus TaxID=450378 RepID=A0A7G6VWH4_9SPHN|nr:alpha/beta fold hydrolase [Croceicoccus marinus]QNE06089.1 alpha/beta fold hydrolase [Croceicoccus marinus]
MTEPSDLPVTLENVTARDGTKLAVHRMDPAGGEGKPLVLLHGLFSSAEVNWIKFGHARQLAEAGFSLFMPDLRAHAHSEAPHDPACYPPSVLVNDLEDVIAHYGLGEGGAPYDLAGFSLGSRTVLGGAIAGLTPRRLALVGMGLEGLMEFRRRAGFFIDAIDNFDTAKRGDTHFFAVSFMKTQKIDRVAARLLLSSTGLAIDRAQLSVPQMPILVLCGTEDKDNGSPEALAEALPDARTAFIPGTHMSSVTEKALGRELVKFFTG